MSLTIILDAKGIERAIARMAHEILEKNKGCSNLVILGIPTRGVYLAAGIRDKIKDIEGESVPLGSLDPTLYRDDIKLKKDPEVLKRMDIPVDIDGKSVILVDDVFFTGRTIRAALNALMDFGRPMGVQLAVLVDRGHRELPIRADYIGRNIPTSSEQDVKVYLKEIDGLSQAVLMGKGEDR